MNELVLVNPKEFGIEESKANELIGNLPQIIKERAILEEQFDKVIKLDIEDSETIDKARELRLLVQKNRTQGINVWHKTTKDFFLKGGQFVDAIKRKENVVNERMENDLTQIEKHAEIKEQKRLEQLQQDRADKLSKYVENAFDLSLGMMEEDVFNAYYNSKKKEYEDRLAAEKKAEEERLETIRIQKLNGERRELLLPYYQFWSEELKETNLGELDQAVIDNTLNSLKELKDQHDKEQEQIRKEKEKLEKEAEKKRKEHEAQLKKEREERERVEKIEREKREKLEAELKAKEEAERKEKQRLLDEEQARLKAEKKARLAPDKDKLLNYAEAINNLELPELKSMDTAQVLADIIKKVSDTIEFIKEKAESL